MMPSTSEEMRMASDNNNKGANTDHSSAFLAAIDAAVLAFICLMPFAALIESKLAKPVRLCD
jgi:hypothetical protein